MNRFPFFFLLLSLPILAQAPPVSDIHLADLDQTAWTITNPRDVTPLDTYNNQPSFLPDGTLFYTCHVDDQTDIFHYDPKSNRTTRLTYSQESEYSPTLTPDGRRFSTIRVEHDGTQRLWVFPRNGGAGEILLPKIKPVGYHVWLSGSHLAMFILGNPHHLAEMKSGMTQPRKVLENIGRCLLKIPGQDAYSVTQSTGRNRWALQRIDIATGEATELTAMPGNAQDYAWTADGVVISAAGSKIYRRKPGVDADWILIADLAELGLKGLSRMAISPSGRHIALVSAK